MYFCPSDNGNFKERGVLGKDLCRPMILPYLTSYINGVCIFALLQGPFALTKHSAGVYGPLVPLKNHHYQDSCAR